MIDDLYAQFGFGFDPSKINRDDYSYQEFNLLMIKSMERSIQKMKS